MPRRIKPLIPKLPYRPDTDEMSTNNSARFLMQANLTDLGAATLVLVTYALISEPPPLDSLALDSISDETQVARCTRDEAPIS